MVNTIVGLRNLAVCDSALGNSQPEQNVMVARHDGGLDIVTIPVHGLIRVFENKTPRS